MSFESITNDYLDILKRAKDSAELSADFTAELSYKPMLHNYFCNIAKIMQEDIDVIFEPAHQGESGRPDWRFYDRKSLGSYGYIEGKGLSWTSLINIADYQLQIEKYLKLRSNLVLTDGVEFCFFGANFHEVKRLSLIEKNSSSQHKLSSPSIISDLELAFRSFFKTPGFRNCSESELIQEAAKRAQALSEISMKLSDIPLGSGMSKAENDSISALKNLRELLLKHHDPALKDHSLFADFIAQVLVFSLLYAQRFITSPADEPVDRMRKMKGFWSQPSGGAVELLPFHELILNLNKNFSFDGGIIGPLQSWYDDCCRCLAHIQLKKSSPPDFHTLYENFLKAYDPQKKIDFGAFYTNPILADMMVKVSEYLAVHEIGIKSIFGADNNVIDPCCGTGTFIESIIKNTIGGDLVNISGFEIQPAPYALANYRIALLREKFQFNHNVKIVLTNTLSDKLEEKITAPCDLFEQEQLFAKELVRSPLILVIGNPPSSDAQKQHTAGNGFKIIQKMLDDFRPPSSERKGRQNTQKQLQNDFMKFMRWACEKVLLNNNGILAFVIPSSFFESPTYEYARIWMASKFNKIWLLKFDEDNRKGGAAKNIFNTLQGRSVIFAIRGESLRNTVCSFFFKDISNLSVEEKLNFCKESPKKFLSNFTQTTPGTSVTLGLGEDASLETQTQYEKCWPLYPVDDTQAQAIFLRHCSGIKLAPTALFVHGNPHVLLRRCKEIADLTTATKDIITQWFAGQRKPVSEEKLPPQVRMAFSSVVQKDDHIKDKIKKYSFRPFISSYVLLDSYLFEAIKKEGGGGTRQRPELLNAYSQSSNVGFAVAPAPKDIGTSLHRFVSFCWHIPDNDLCSRQNAHIFCAQYPDYKSSMSKATENPYGNVSKALLSSDMSETEWVYYVYAIMSSNWYLSLFSDMLYVASNKIPRIPIHSDTSILLKVAKIGKLMAECENSNIYDFSKEQFFEENINNYQTEFNFDKYEIDNGSVRFYSKQSKSPQIEIKNISNSILSLRVSGYDVVSTWLKFRTYAYTRMKFSREDYSAFINFLCATDKQLRLLRELDQFLAYNFEDDNNWK